MIKVLVENGANINAKYGEGNTPLDIAEQNDYGELIDILKKYGGVEI